MKIFKDGHKTGITPPNHFGGLNVLDIVPLAGRDFSVQVSKAPKGGGGELHHHDDMTQIFYVVEGALTFATGQERFTLNKGEAVVFEPFDPHYTINERDEECVSLVISFRHKKD